MNVAHVISRLAPFAIVIVLVGLTHWYAYSRGEARATAEHGLELEKMRRASATAHAQLERRARDAEHDAVAALAAQSQVHANEARYAQKQIDTLRADLRASRVRLSVPAASCAAASSPSADPAAAGGPGATARVELMPETAADLIGIAADGDAAVRQLNRLIDAYNELREGYNAIVADGGVR